MVPLMQRISTAADLITALGGDPAVAEHCDVKLSAVRNWRMWDAFPERVLFRLSRLADRKKLRVDPALYERRAPRNGRAA